MKSNEELEQEYQKFVIKVAKANKDFSDAINELSPKNLNRFKQEMRHHLPMGFIKLCQLLKD